MGILAEEAVEVAAEVEDGQVILLPPASLLAQRTEPGSTAVGRERVVVGVGKGLIRFRKLLELSTVVPSHPAVAPPVIGDAAAVAAKIAGDPIISFRNLRRQIQRLPHPAMRGEQPLWSGGDDTPVAEADFLRDESLPAAGSTLSFHTFKLHWKAHPIKPIIIEQGSLEFKCFLL